MATPQQGTYLGTTLAAFTAFAGGLAARESYPSGGVLIALIGLVLLIYSVFGFVRIKGLK